MATVWLTYSWLDNQQNDVDFYAHELEKAGVIVKRDQWTLRAGERLWEQIYKHITDPDGCDAFVIFATHNSLNSEACKEEIYTALKRALASKMSFPIVPLFRNYSDISDVAALGIRLGVSLEDEHWKERIKAAAEGREPSIPRIEARPYVITVHQLVSKIAIEMRPRIGAWPRFLFAYPKEENHQGTATVCFGVPGHVPSGGFTWGGSIGTEILDKTEWIIKVSDSGVPSPSVSAYAIFYEKPKEIIFGTMENQYHERL